MTMCVINIENMQWKRIQMKWKWKKEAIENDQWENMKIILKMTKWNEREKKRSNILKLNSIIIWKK